MKGFSGCHPHPNRVELGIRTIRNGVDITFGVTDQFTTHLAFSVMSYHVTQITEMCIFLKILIKILFLFSKLKGKQCFILMSHPVFLTEEIGNDYRFLYKKMFDGPFCKI